MNGRSLPFQSLPFDRLRTEQGERTGKVFSDKFPPSSSGRSRTNGASGLEIGTWKPRAIKNGLRTLFYIRFRFFAIRGERVKNPSALSLPNHQQHLFPFVLSLSK
ncbi:MAG: hypothetical protein LBD67_00260 [Candidatus Accumulibacter sp.]|jgi:hypothetical protein|nr:hypothetical protein [Accumulibacter sp.]